MNTTVETIQQKITHLPTDAQEEVLEIVKIIEKRYTANDKPEKDLKDVEYPLTTIGKIRIDFEHSDLAERHDFYAHNKLEE